jgi:predicted nucleic-acid-binding protein
VLALDTNVLVRVLVGDDPVQTPKAERVFSRAASAGGVFISLVVLAELAWVLGQGYGWERATVHARLAQLVRTRGVAVESIEIVEQALEGYGAGAVDFADHLILGKARAVGADALCTFDRKLAREPGVRPL